MFICEECLKKYTNFAVPISRGPCEDCGKVGNCADIGAGDLNYKKEIPNFNQKVLDKIIRKKILWAEVKAKEQEYGRLQKQIDELEQAKKDVSFEVQKRIEEAGEIADFLLEVEYEGLKAARK